MLRFILAMVAVVGFVTAEANSSKKGKTSIADQIKFPVTEFKLDNGLTVLIHEDHSAPIYSYHQWFRVGSRNEKPGRTGLAHFFEHLMFKGTEKIPGKELERIIQANGGTNNAFTTHDYTGYYENMPSGTLESVVRIEADRMVNLIFKEDEIQKEREVVKEERRFRVDNSVRGYLNEAVYRTVFKVHPYRWPVIGSMRDLNAATVSDLRDFYRVNYAPNNSIVVIVGDVNAKKAEKLIRKYYAAIPSQPLPKDSYRQEPKQRGSRETTLKKDVQNVTFTVAFRASKAGEDDSYALDLLAGILGNGTSSRMYKRLVYRQQLASSVSVWAYTPADPGFFQVNVSVKPGQDYSKALRSVYGELYKVRKYNVSEKELEKVKNQVMKDYVSSLKTVSGKARALAVNEVLFGDYSEVFKDLDRYNKVTIEQIRKVAEKYLIPSNRSVIKVIPKSSQGV